MQRDLETLRASFSNFISYMVAEVQALHSQGEPGWKGLWMGGDMVGDGLLNPEHGVPCPPGGSLQATITSLKGVVENQEQELQAGEKPSRSECVGVGAGPSGQRWGGCSQGC